jgi:carboxypeptidase PM20D1
MKALLKLLVLAAVGLAGVLVARALALPTEGLEAPPAVEVAVAPGAIDRFAAALRFPTVSHGDAALFDLEPFEDLRRYLEVTYPLVHETLRLEMVGGLSLLYTWPGSDPNLPPVILLAHSDVVPIEPGTEGDWTHPPFSGLIVEGEVWGRGAMDDKASLVGILEAAEGLLGRGFRPERTLLFSFGHDEEIGGVEGARAVASLLEARGVKGAFVLDEGMVIVEDVLPGVEGPVALLGLAEKGYISVLLAVEVEGGHSSTPPSETAIGILARAVDRLEARPMPGRLEGPSRMMLETLGPGMPFRLRLVMGNLWLFGGLVTRMMAGAPETAAAVRTTTAPTLFQAGVKDNILPSQAQAVVNFRILPGDSSEDVLAHVAGTVDDPRVRVEVYQNTSTEPSPVSSTESFGYQELRTTIQEVFPGTEVAPFLTLGGTDSKHFVAVAEDVYRFAPLRFRPDLASGVHGTNERIPVEDYLDMVRFYTRLMERTGG